MSDVEQEEDLHLVCTGLVCRICLQDGFFNFQLGGKVVSDSDNTKFNHPQVLSDLFKALQGSKPNPDATLMKFSR